MINYLLINLILSGSALAINQWLPIPHRIRFYALMLAVIAWLLPFGLMGIEISQQSAAVLPIQVMKLNQPMMAVNQVVVEQFNYPALFGLLMLIGMLLFIRDLLCSHRLIKRLKTTAIPLNKNRNIKLTREIHGAFVSGYFKPIIWINQKFLHEENIQTIITHEKQHILNHDPHWLLIITCIQRLMWFNPLAYITCHKTRQAIELSCDEACKQKIGTTKYQTHLAQIMLNNSQPQHMLLHNSINHNNNFNINRIKQLNQENTMTKSNTSKFIFIILSAVLMASFTLVTVAKENPMPTIKDHQVLLTLKIKSSDKQPTDLSILTNQGEKANVTYDNHDFGFTTQIMPEEPTQIYTNIVISEIENGVKTEISNPGIVTTNSQWGGFKFGQGENYFDIEIMAQTSSQLDPVVEAVDNYIKVNDPIPAALTRPTSAPEPDSDFSLPIPPEPVTAIHPNQPPQPIAISEPMSDKAPKPDMSQSAPRPVTAPEPPTSGENQ